ncbi:hypothetical protein DRE_02736 [Drechslerella stenobrocha 248]|uniref:C2H2-type domain-containing protein n=1 Tax=Drechslerella stenobrocha 248 TaxID=1043628 RepID=W7HWE0_9PEZI|nr:hypothetical protein DRE_02736 [Drechslerella stenobrocha 248]
MSGHGQSFDTMSLRRQRLPNLARPIKMSRTATSSHTFHLPSARQALSLKLVIIYHVGPRKSTRLPKHHPSSVTGSSSGARHLEQGHRRRQEMLQLDTRQSWTPPPFLAAPEFSQSSLRSDRSVFSMLLARATDMGNSSQYHDCPGPLASHGIVGSASSSSASASASAAERRPAQPDSISRTITSGTLPAAKASVSGGGGSRKYIGQPSSAIVKQPGFNLPPICPTTAAAFDNQRASSPSPSPSPSSLLPSISEPQPPSLRGRTSSVSSRCSASLATDNTPANSPTHSPAPRGQSPSPLPPPASLLSPAPVKPVATAPSPGPKKFLAPAAPLVLTSDPLGAHCDIDNKAVVVAALDHCSLPPPPHLALFTVLANNRASGNPLLKGYIGDPAPSLPKTACNLSPKSVPSGFRNPSSSPVPKYYLPGICSVAALSAHASKLHSDTKGAVVPPSFDEELKTASVDTSIKTALVLAHRASTVIKRESIPRLKTTRSLFATENSRLYPFNICRKLHDGVMESEEESDYDSVATSSSSCKQRMMEPHRRRLHREEKTPDYSDAFAGIPPDPTPGPKPLPSSPREPCIHHPGLFALITTMGDNKHPGLAQEAHCEPKESSDNGDQRIEKANEDSHEEKGNSGTNHPPTNSSWQAIRQVNLTGGGGGSGGSGDGDGDGDPNRRLRNLSEHEQDHDTDTDYSNRTKRRRVERERDHEDAVFQSKGRAGQDTAVNSLFNLSNMHSRPSSSSTFEASPQTLASIDITSSYKESVATSDTTGEKRANFYKHSVEDTRSMMLPPIQPRPGTTPAPPRPTDLLPGVSSLLPDPSPGMEHPLDSQPINPHNSSGVGGKGPRARVTQRLNVAFPPESHHTTAHSRSYLDSYGRPPQYNDSASRYRNITSGTRHSPTTSPTEKKNTHIDSTPPKYRSSTSPISQSTSISLNSYIPPRNLGRQHHVANQTIQTELVNPISVPELNSAKPPASKVSKRARNGTPKNGSGDSSQSSPSTTDGFKCPEEGCTAAPFSTQYLLNSHANVHSEERPHFCPVAKCPRGESGKGFKRKNEMIRHRLVHDSPGYACPFCPDKEHKYPRPDNLQRHVKAHHKDKGSDDPLLREVLAVRPEGGQRGRRRRLGPTT